MFGAFLLLRFLLQFRLLWQPAAGHEHACTASEEGSVRSSSLIQGISQTHRGALMQRSAEKAANDSDRPRLAKTTETHHDDMVQGAATSLPRLETHHDDMAQGAFTSMPRLDQRSSSPSHASDGAKSKQSPWHRAVALLQHRSFGSVGPVMFITAVFFLMGVVLILMVAITPHGSFGWDDPPPGHGDSGAGMPKLVHENVAKGQAAPPMSASQYSVTSVDAYRRSTSVTHSSTVSSPIREGDVNPKVLSPQLVVPDDCECALVLKMPTSEWRGSFSICDTRGSAVLKVMITNVLGTGSTGGQPALEIHLSSVSQPISKVARCRLLRVSTKPTFLVYQGESTELFATLTSDTAGKAQLVLAEGSAFALLGEDLESLRFVDENNLLHGTCEPHDPTESSAVANVGGGEGKLCLVRIGPLSDAGLVLCGFICFHQLKLASAIPGY